MHHGGMILELYDDPEPHLEGRYWSDGESAGDITLAGRRPRRRSFFGLYLLIEMSVQLGGTNHAVLDASQGFLP